MTWQVVFNTSSKSYRLRGIDGGTVHGLAYGVMQDLDRTIQRGLDAGVFRIETSPTTPEALTAKARADALNGGTATPSIIPVADSDLLRRIERLEEVAPSPEGVKADIDARVALLLASTNTWASDQTFSGVVSAANANVSGSLFSQFLGVNTAPTVNAQTTIHSGATGRVGLLVRGITGQTADLQQWQSSTGTPLAKVRSDGGGSFATTAGSWFDIGGNAGAIVNVVAPTNGLLMAVRGAVSQTADLTQWQSNAGAVLARVRNDGSAQFPYLGATDTYFGSINAADGIRVAVNNTLTVYPTSASVAGLQVKGRASQTADLQQWQNSAGTVLARVTAAGHVSTDQVNATYVMQVGPVATPASTNVFTSATAASHIPLIARGAASQSADLTQWQNSTGTVLASVNSSGTIVGNNGVYSSSGGSANWAAFLTTSRATDIGTIIRGAASQTADLTQWQNSAGTVLAKVRHDGLVGAPFFTNAADSGPYFEMQEGYTSVVGRGTANGPLFSAINHAPAQLALRVRGAASQSADLQQWQDSAGTVLASINASGEYERVTAGGGIVLRSPNGTRYRVTVNDTGALATAAA